MNDADLINRSLQGDEDASEEIYRRYFRLVCCLCHDATPDRLEAEDLCQEVFVRVFSRLGQLRDPAALPSWIIRITKNVVRSTAGKRRPTAVGTNDSPSGGADESHDDTLRAAIRRLPERERLAVHLFYLQEKPVEVARHALGVSRTNFYELLKSARARLATLIVH